MTEFEIISYKSSDLAIIIKSSYQPDHTEFLTPPHYKQQVGFVVYPKGGEIARHTHRPIERHLMGTSEVLIVKKGSCLINIFSDDHELVATRELGQGDIMLMVGGGHGFTMLEDTVLIEVKQGPYTGLDEKERF